MQKQVYEAPDLMVYGNIESLTAGQSEFSPRCFNDPGSGCSYKHNSYNPPRTNYYNPPRHNNYHPPFFHFGR